MQLLPQDPRKRKTLLIIIGAGAAVVGLGFFLMNYGIFGAPEGAEQSVSITGGKVSEGALKIIEGNVSALREELQNDFYRSLKRYKWTTDTAVPGKKDPFGSQRVGSSE
ncbi:hypothetical protein HY839_00105 [Candidatus Azambacteria bacterium]|nr:hypothetical protein [Candidatus Azambacteria bacterium]